MPTATGILIDGPAPRAPKYTLLGAATLVQMTQDEHYLMGLAVRSYPCTQPSVWDWRNESGQKALATSTPNPLFPGFTVYLAEQCNARGLTPEDYASRINRVFGAVEAFAVERAFYTGITNSAGSVSAPGLATEMPVPGGADSTLYPTGNTAQTAVEGLAQLEAAIATTGQGGIIHTTPTLASSWKSKQLLERINTTPETLQTVNGTVVVPGYGYQQVATIFNGSTPVAPAGHTAPTGTQEWAYATGPIEVRRTADIEMIPEPTQEDVWMALDRVNNLLTYEATRHYIYDWGACFKAAVKVDRAT